MTPAENTAATAPQDERLAHVGFLARLLQRPDTGALIGGIAVFLLFAWTARQVNWAGDAGIWSSWLNTAAYDGIVAVPVALLMIGGEFDLSAGVMIGSIGPAARDPHHGADWNMWLSIAVVLLFGAADRPDQRLRGREDEAAELHRHAGDVLRAARRQRGR